MQISAPSLIHHNLKNNLWRRSSLTHLPTSHILERDSFDHSNIGIKGVLAPIHRLVKAKIVVDRVQVLTEVPLENLYKIMGKARMGRALTQQVILSGMPVVVVDNFLINVLLHNGLL